MMGGYRQARRIAMTRRPGFHTITPYIMIPEVLAFLEFLKQVFAAEETFRAIGSAGGLHIEVLIGDSMLMLGGAVGGEPKLATLHLYLDDVDQTYQRALEAGATSLDAPKDFDDGDRRAGVTDPFGNIWYLATTIAR
jgi:PhnB protein